MKLLEYQNKINELMTAFVTQIKGATAMGRTDIKVVSETVLIPILSEVYGFKNLKNLNYEESNYPGIDLGDDKARVAVQVTSTTSIEKVKETLPQKKSRSEKEAEKNRFERFFKSKVSYQDISFQDFANNPTLFL